MQTLGIVVVALMSFLMANAAQAELARVVPGYKIQLPRDGGSHPEFGIEWWYVTGWLQCADGAPTGFQITFFRSRNEAADGNPSKFAAKQLLFAHAALSHPKVGKLLRAEQSARLGFGIAEAKQGLTDVVLNDWYLRETSEGYEAKLTSGEFSLAITLKTSQPPLLQGDRGLSRKGPKSSSASYYYSVPQLEVHGTVAIKNGKPQVVTGSAWFDHEWSSEYMDAEASGWDWIGINMHNGDALMAFRIRDAKNNSTGAAQWAGGSHRSGKTTHIYSPTDVTFSPLHNWKSPRTNVEYPIAWRVNVGAQEFTLRPLMEDQENDARGSVGVLYWEGAVEALDVTGAAIGQGYLELTGYGQRLKM